MTRIRLAVAVLLPMLVAALGVRSAVAHDQRTASCLGARATIVGTAGRDVLRGTQKRDVIVGLAGRDRIEARGGDDLVCGGAGDDILNGGPGRNRLDGGPGYDRCVAATRSRACELPVDPGVRIEGTTIDGKRISLADFRGRPVFVNVWSSW